MSDFEDISAQGAGDDELIGILIRHVLSRTRVGGSKAYQQAVKRFSSDPDFRERAEAVMQGMGLRVLDYSVPYGVVVGATPGSPFAGKIDDFLDQRLANDTAAEQRFVRGAIMVAIAAAAYPAAVDVGSVSGQAFSVSDVVSILQRAANQVSPPSEDEEEAAHRLEAEEVIARVIRNLPASDDAKRRGTRSLMDVAHNLVKRLEDMGYLSALPADADGTVLWQPLWPLQAVMRDAADRSLVSTLRAISAETQARAPESAR